MPSKPHSQSAVTDTCDGALWNTPHRKQANEKALPVSNAIGIRNLSQEASRVLRTMPINAATTFTVRVLMCEAVNKSNANYRGNVNRRNVRCDSEEALPHLTRKCPVAAEYMVPISVMLADHLYAAVVSVTETEAFARLVSQYATMELIIKDEDASLRKHRLQCKMPTNWGGVDIFARYRAVGIEVMPVEALETGKLPA